MKAIPTTLLILGLAIISAAQSSSDESKRKIGNAVGDAGQLWSGLTAAQSMYPLDLKITSVDFVSGDTSEPDSRAIFSIKVRNDGIKAITAVNWEYLFLDKTHGHRIVDRVQFRADDRTIEVRQEQSLTKRFEYIETPDYIEIWAFITRIEYIDGSVWARPPG